MEMPGQFWQSSMEDVKLHDHHKKKNDEDGEHLLSISQATRDAVTA
jgi:hypothetical protein